ncbi:MAG TPA: site-2 protease family protein [Thermoanaerobaculia bacterium]|nr:site-2 protease family protein [Thermoanaerobaculia bacterium]
MTLLFVTFIGTVVFSLWDLVAVAVVGRTLGARPLELGLFIGPRKVLFHIGTLPFSLGLIPIGNYVRFLSLAEQDGRSDQNLDSPIERGAEREWHSMRGPAEPRFFEQLHPLRRIAIILSGAVVLFITAAAVLGISEATASVLAGFPQILRGAFDHDYAEQLLLGGASLIPAGRILEYEAVLLTKLLSVNLLPILPFWGGYTVLYLASMFLKREVSVPGTLESTSILIAIVVSGIWIVRFLNVAFR